MADAVRSLAREVVGAPAPKEDRPPRLGTRAKITILVAAVDLGLLGVLFEDALTGPFATFVKSLVPLLFGGALVAYTDELRKGLHRWANEGVALATAIVAAGILALPVFFPLPLPVEAEPLARLSLDSTELGPRPEARRVIRVAGFRSHGLTVVEQANRQEFSAELRLSRLDLLAGSLVAGFNLLPGVDLPGFRLHANYPAEIRKDARPAILELMGYLPRLSRQGLSGHSDWYVRRSGNLYRVGIPLDAARLADVHLPPGEYRVTLIHPDCSQDLGRRSILRADTATKLHFITENDTLPCEPLERRQ